MCDILKFAVSKQQYNEMILSLVVYWIKSIRAESTTKEHNRNTEYDTLIQAFLVKCAKNEVCDSV